MRFVLSIRCLPKILSSWSTSTSSQIATLRRSLMWTNVETWTVTVNGKYVRLTTSNSSPSLVQHNTSPHRHSQLSDLTIRLYSTTSLKSISLKWWLYHQCSNCLYWSVQLCRSNAKWRHQSFFTLIGQSSYSWQITLIWPSFMYVNIKHQSFIFSKSIMVNRWQRLSFNTKLARD